MAELFFNAGNDSANDGNVVSVSSLENLESFFHFAAGLFLGRRIGGTSSLSELFPSSESSLVDSYISYSPAASYGASSSTCSGISSTSLSTPASPAAGGMTTISRTRSESLHSSITSLRVTTFLLLSLFE